MDKSDHGPFLFSRPGLIFLLGLTLAGAWYQQLVLTLLTSTVLVIGLSAHGWSALSLRRVVYLRRTSPARIFPGEEVELTLILENRKLLPLSWVEAADRVPLALMPEGLDLGTRSRSRGRNGAGPPGQCGLHFYGTSGTSGAIACRADAGGITNWDRFASLPGTCSALFPVSQQPGRLITFWYIPGVHDLFEPALPSRFPLGEVQAASPPF